MSARRGLGRGLGALLGEGGAAGAATAAAAPPAAAAATNGLHQVPLDRIAPNPNQPRKAFDEAALGELERSIRELGVLVPIIVRDRGGQRYELIAGERRLRAAKAAGLATIPAIIRPADDRESLELAVVENLQREDLDPLEEAAGFSNLIEEFGFTQERLAERIGKSRPAIANALRLLELPDEIKKHVHTRAITAGHARALLAAPSSERAKLAQRIVDEGLTVRAVERIAARPRKTAKSAPKGRQRGHDVESVESRLRYRLGTQATIVRRGRSGRIEIRFVDESDLMRIVDVILGE